MTKITLDLDKLIKDGAITQDEAARLTGLGEPSGRMGVLINVLLIIGAIAVAAGVIALEPSASTGLLLALLALGGGGALFFIDKPEWRVLSHGLVIMGCLGLCGWIGWQAAESWKNVAPITIHLSIFAIVTAGAVVFRQAFLAALSPLALGAILGSGTAYWHASYGLFVREPTLTILVFTVIAAGLFWARGKVESQWRLITTVAARVSFFMLNFAFWVGSLWGDYVGELWTEDMNWEATEAWRETAIEIPEAAFSLGWLLMLGLCIWWGTRDNRRFLANTAITFLAIHFYTQLFETLGAEPTVLIFCGLTMVGAAVGITRFDRWLQGIHADKDALPPPQEK